MGERALNFVRVDTFSRHFYVLIPTSLTRRGKLTTEYCTDRCSIIVTNIIIIDAIALALAGGEGARGILLFINFFTAERTQDQNALLCCLRHRRS